MTESHRIQKPKKKKANKKKEQKTTPEIISAEKKKKLKELDQFIEGVLQEAGEEFLDEFKQVEGE